MFGSRQLLASSLLWAGCGVEDSLNGADDSWTMSASSTGGGPTPQAATLSDSTADDTSGVDPTTGGESTGDAQCYPVPPSQPWMLAYHAEVVGRLTGQQEALPGVTLGVRETLAQRMATGDYLLAELAALGLGATEHTYSAAGRNVYATLPATDGSDDVYVLGAHFDTVPQSPGANDNATGVALVLSVARYLRDVPCRRANTIFVLFDQEEVGLVGSDAFAAFLVEQDLPVVAVHTIDQMGWDADGDRAIELERADDGLLDAYAAAAREHGLSIPLTPTDTGFTDHVSFRAYGFAAVGVTEEFVSGDSTPHYHMPSDTYDTVDPQYLLSTAALLHAVFADIVG